ncbi:MAG: IS110 family transposase, partial [Nitrospinae bacterium]|nr:IS110 family transposase [Nitrospinota bacterium]
LLYMAALSATRHNPAIRAIYRRLIEGGKKFKVAITACMRKLLIKLNAMIKNGSTWKPEYASAP